MCWGTIGRRFTRGQEMQRGQEMHEEMHERRR